MSNPASARTSSVVQAADSIAADVVARAAATDDVLRQRIVRGGAPPVRPEAYADAALAPAGAKYRPPPLPLLSLADALADRPELAALYNRWLCARLIAEFTFSGQRLRLPRSVKQLYPAEFTRILDQLDQFDDDFYRFEHEPFCKDLAVLTHRLIPVGAEYAQPQSGVPISVLLKGGPRQLLTGALFMLWRARGFGSFLSLHMHILSTSEFHFDGWQRTYHRLAEIMELNPTLRGWISASWFLDPQLALISPRLAHLREVPTDNGAALFFLAHEGADSDALFKSPTRRRLFASGEYRPAKFMRVWPRAALIAWHRRVRDGVGGS